MIKYNIDFFYSDFSAILLRITKMMRGIGDPLVAVYARCYLCRVGFNLNNSNLNYVKENFYDFLYMYKQLFSSPVKIELEKQSLSLQTYLNLYTPSLDWILQILTVRADESLLTEILDRCKQQPNR